MQNVSLLEHEPELLALASLNVFGMASAAITGFGENILVQIGWHVLQILNLASGELSESDFILTVISIPLLLWQVVYLRKQINAKLSGLNTFNQAIGAALGVALLYVCTGFWLKRVLGAVLLLVATWSTLKEVGISRIALSVRATTSSNNHLLTDGENVLSDAVESANVQEREELAGNQVKVAYDPCTSMWRVAFVSIVGITSGLLGGLFACPGPPNMIFVLCVGIAKDEWRATSAASNLVQLIVRLAIMLPRELSGSAYLWLECSVSLAGGFLGILIGNGLAAYVSEKWFRRFIIFFLFTGGSSMIFH